MTMGTISKKYKRDGLLMYMPKKLKNALLNLSFYDILCEIFIIRSFYTKIHNIVYAFISSNSPEEARQILNEMRNKNISKSTHKFLFTKGIVNNFPKKLKNLMLPED